MNPIKMPSIGQFRQTCGEVGNITYFQGLDADGSPIYDKNLELPVLEFVGTIKLHGTNASFVLGPDGVYFQAKTRILSATSDNAGFYIFGNSRVEEFKELATAVADHHSIDLSSNYITLYGEWCGCGIQSGVAISELDKMFVMFGAKVTPLDGLTDSYWVSVDGDILKLNYGESGIHNIYHFPHYRITIDFNNPGLSQNELGRITSEVEAQCPVAKAFGVEGIGEGVVWTGSYKSKTLRFKVKGDKHSSSKVKKLASVDAEKLKGIVDFIDYAVTTNRLEQGITEVFNSGEKLELVRENTGPYVRWVIADVAKEELDTLEANGLVLKDVAGKIAKKASAFFNQFLNEQAGIN